VSNGAGGCDCVRKVLKQVSRSRVVESPVSRPGDIINHRDHRARLQEDALCASNQSSVKLVLRSASITCSCVVEALVPRPVVRRLTQPPRQRGERSWRLRVLYWTFYCFQLGEQLLVIPHTMVRSSLMTGAPTRPFESVSWPYSSSTPKVVRHRR
jgi:hypothetical protein